MVKIVGVATFDRFGEMLVQINDGGNGPAAPRRGKRVPSGIQGFHGPAIIVPTDVRVDKEPL